MVHVSHWLLKQWLFRVGTVFIGSDGKNDSSELYTVTRQHRDTCGGVIKKGIARASVWMLKGHTAQTDREVAE